MRVKLEHRLPDEIEKKSFAIIEKELKGTSLPSLEKPIILRVIHTTADFEYKDNLVFSSNAVKRAVEALKKGASIVTDTTMGMAGIHKSSLEKLGGKVYCFMSDEDVAKEAKERHVTRAAVCMEKALNISTPLIIAIGNAPTALIRLYELYEERQIQPELIIGVPVGFVNVVEAKELILKTDAEYIVAKGRKGGSNVAAAICNALIYLASGER